MDFQRAAMLLHIVDLARQWPNLKGLHDAAMTELEDMSAGKSKVTATNTPYQSMERKI